MVRLYLSPLVREVIVCLDSRDRKKVVDCLARVCDMERRMVLGFYTALLMKSYGLDRTGEEDGSFIQVGPIGGEYVEGLPGVVAAVMTSDGDKLCVETITWSEVRRVLL